jgi:hypothetical protein
MSGQNLLFDSRLLNNSLGCFPHGRRRGYFNHAHFARPVAWQSSFFSAARRCRPECGRIGRMFLRHPCQCQMGNPASNPTGSVRDPYGGGRVEVGGGAFLETGQDSPAGGQSRRMRSAPGAGSAGLGRVGRSPREDRCQSQQAPTGNRPGPVRCPSGHLARRGLRPTGISGGGVPREPGRG